MTSYRTLLEKTQLSVSMVVVDSNGVNHNDNIDHGFGNDLANY